LDKDLVLAEVPPQDFRAEWDRIYRKALIKDLRRRGLSRDDAKNQAEQFLRQWREWTSFRLKSHYDEGSS
jgi:hypothetical protein